MPSTGCSPPVCTEATSSGPTNRSDAGERGQREGQAHQQRAEITAAFGSLIELGEQARRQRQFKRAQQAQSEDDEDQRDESVHPGAVAELHHAERSGDGFQAARRAR